MSHSHGIKSETARFFAVNEIQSHLGWIGQIYGIDNEDWQECQSWWETTDAMFGPDEILSADVVRRIIVALRERDWEFQEGFGNDCSYRTADQNLANRLEAELIRNNKAI